MNEMMNNAAETAEAVETVESAAIAAEEEARAGTDAPEATGTDETDFPEPTGEERGDEEREEDVRDERDLLIEAEPLKEVKDRNGETWLRLFCDRKTVLVKEELIGAMTWNDESTDPLIHLKNAKDVLRINPASWRALNERFFGEYVY